jgi:RND family efflux transporter MFP subunit
MNPVPSIAVVAALGGAALLAACGGRAEKASLPPVAPAVRAVRVGKPAAGLETGLGRATGGIRARADATLSAKVTGQIKRLKVEVGDRVRAGAPLVEMDSTNARIQLDNARALERLAAAGLAEAEREVTRAKVLFEQGSLPQAGWDKAQTGRELAAAQLDQARAAVRAAAQAVADTTIVAPFAGTVTARWHNAGDTVTLMPVSPIVAVTDLDHLEAKLAVPEAIESFVKPGGRVEGVTTPGGQRFQATVRVKGGVVDPATRTLEVLADVAAVQGPPLRPGTLVNVDFGAFGAAGEMFVPASAVRADGDKKYVLVVAAGKAERRDVEAAPVNPGTMAVRKGLDAQADVILDPGALAAGDAVTFLPQ